MANSELEIASLGWKELIFPVLQGWMNMWVRPKTLNEKPREQRQLSRFLRGPEAAFPEIRQIRAPSKKPGLEFTECHRQLGAGTGGSAVAQLFRQHY